MPNEKCIATLLSFGICIRDFIWSLCSATKVQSISVRNFWGRPTRLPPERFVDDSKVGWRKNLDSATGMTRYLKGQPAFLDLSSKMAPYLFVRPLAVGQLVPIMWEFSKAMDAVVFYAVLARACSAVEKWWSGHKAAAIGRMHPFPLHRVECIARFPPYLFKCWLFFGVSQVVGGRHPR